MAARPRRWVSEVAGIPSSPMATSSSARGFGDEVLRGEDVVAHKPVSTNCPPPLRPGPASSCLVTAIGRNETMRQGIDARLATLTTLAKAGQASWCSPEDWIQGGA